MILHIKPSEYLKGRVVLPASKSYSIRSFIIASCAGKSKIVNPSLCDDSMVAMKVAKQLGSKVSKIEKNVCLLEAKSTHKNPAKINVHESGTVLRFLLPLVSLKSKSLVVDGEGTLKGRPNLFLTRTLRKMGVFIKGRGPQESVPIKFEGGMIKGGQVNINGSLSSQFISALLISCPMLSEDTVLRITGKKIVSYDYIEMTLLVLKQAGINIKVKDQRTFLIKGNQKYRGLQKFIVPSDLGLAAFLMAAAALVKSEVVLDGHFNNKLIQADGHILPLLKSMGVKIQQTSKSIRIKGPFRLKSGDFSLANCPDLLPIMAVLALFADGKCRFYDIKHARVKESDRISDLRKELLKIEANVSERENELIVTPASHYKNDCILDPHKDHRLAMAFSVLGLKVGVRVKDIECSSKSYPGFVKDFMALGAKLRKTR